MPAFNKRHRETTYAGMKLKPLGAGAASLICTLMAFTTIFNNNQWVLGIFLALVAIGSLVFAIYELVNDDDIRIRQVKFKARAVRNKRQTML